MNISFREKFPISSYNIYDYNAFLDDIFDTFEGTRLCGAQACPPNFLLHFNMSEEGYFHVLPKNTSTVLAVVYAGLCLVAAMTSAAGLDRIRMYVYQDPLERPEGLAALRAVRESFRDVRLQMAAPLALFIGFEQAFMYADFSKVGSEILLLIKFLFFSNNNLPFRTVRRARCVNGFIIAFFSIFAQKHY